MKQLLATISNKFLTRASKGLAKTGCFVFCHRLETPDELL